MTTGPAGPGGNGPNPPHAPAPGTGEGPDGDEADVLYLAGQRPPAAGAWLLVTAMGAPGGQFTAQVLPGAGASAFGGDVVVHLVPDDPATGPPPAARVQVHAVLGGRLIPVASWPGQDLDGWPERIRTAVAFAMDVLTELEEHDAELGAGIRVDLSQAAGQATAGVPLHLTLTPGKATPLAP